jgi:hypothetical protein
MRLFVMNGLLVVFACAVLTAAASASHVRVIRLKSVTVSGTVKDVPPKGPSKGDRYAGQDTLVNLVEQFGRKAGAVVGTDSSTLTLTSKNSGCIAGFARLPGGTITIKGCTARLGVNIPIPVSGGTGVFTGARGTLTAGPGTSPTNTYRLTLP